MSDGSDSPKPGDPPPPLEMQRRLARTVTSPAKNAKDAVVQWPGVYGTPFDRGLLLELEAQIAAIQAGDLDRPTAVLAAQVETLNTVFHALLRSAFEYRGTPYQEQKLRLAMREQARIAATVQKLVDIKNPRPVAYVQQISTRSLRKRCAHAEGGSILGGAATAVPVVSSSTSYQAHIW